MLPLPETCTSFDPVSHDLLSAAVKRHCAITDATTEVRLSLPLPAGVTTHLRSFQPSSNLIVVAEPAHGFEKRNREFAAGRFCAQHALKQLAINAEVPVDTDRKPIWPQGIVGSISHSDNYAWAATARKGTIAGIGIDTETVVDDATLSQISKEITIDAEQELLAKIPHDGNTAFTILFSAKEAIYKCLYPKNEQYFGFHDVQLIDANDHSITFAQQPSNPNFSSAPRHLTVQYAVVQNDVFTSIWI